MPPSAKAPAGAANLAIDEFGAIKEIIAVASVAPPTPNATFFNVDEPNTDFTELRFTLLRLVFALLVLRLIPVKALRAVLRTPPFLVEDLFLFLFNATSFLVAAFCFADLAK